MADAKGNSNAIRKKMEELKKMIDHQRRLTKDIVKMATDNEDVAQQVKMLSSVMKAQQKAAMA